MHLPGDSLYPAFSLLTTHPLPFSGADMGQWLRLYLLALEQLWQQLCTLWERMELAHGKNLIFLFFLFLWGEGFFLNFYLIYLVSSELVNVSRDRDAVLIQKPALT